MAVRKPPEGGNTSMSRDRARRINSLHNKVDTMVADQDKKRLRVSSEINALTKEQTKMMKQLDLEKTAFTNETAQAYDGVVKNLGKTIKNLSIGVKNITTDTAKATSGAIAQYGKAVGEDISINKQNTMAMALAKATPLFGYFAAKFMETDVFQSSARKIKEQVSGTLSKAGESLGNVFKKKQSEDVGAATPPKLAEGGYVKKGGIVEVHAAEVVTPIDKLMKKIDNAKATQVGDKLNSVLNILSKNVAGVESLIQSVESERKNMFTTFIDEWKRANSPENLEWRDRLLKGVLELKVAMIGTASRMRIAWQQTLLNHPSFRGMLMFGQTMQAVVTSPFKALFGLRGGFANDVRRATRTSNVYEQQVNLLAIIYSKGMTYLRDIAKFTQVTAEALVGEPVSPVSDKSYTLFGKVREFMTSRGVRGGKKAVFDTFVDSLELDRNSLAEAGITSFGDLLNPGMIMRNMGFTRENIKGKLSEGPEGNKRLYEKIEDAAYKGSFIADQQRIKLQQRYGPKLQAGYTGLTSRAAALQVKGSEAALGAEWHYRKFKNSKAGKDLKDKAGRVKDWSKEKLSNLKTWEARVVDELYRFRKMKEAQEEREGPHSPSMAENIATTAKAAKATKKALTGMRKNLKYVWLNVKRTALRARRRFKKNYKSEMKKQKELAEIRKASRSTAKSASESSKTAKKNRKDAKGWLPFVFSIISNIGSRMRGIATVIGNIGALFLGRFWKMFKGVGKILGKVGKFFASGFGKMFTGASGTAGRVMGGARGALQGGGARGLASWGVRGAAKIGGVALGATGGILLGGAMSIWDAAKMIITNPEGWAQNFMIRGLSAFLGGQETGAAGATSGAIKGASLGSAIGVVGGPLGMAVGAAIGGIAGGILGFVGGKKLSQGMAAHFKAIGDVAKTLWNIVSWPLKFVREVSKILFSIFKFIGKKFFGAIDDALSNIPFVSSVWKWTKWLGNQIFGAFGRLFSAVGDFFKGKSWSEELKDGIVKMLFPLPYLINGLKRIGTVVDGWLSNAPVIGKVYRWAKRFAKDVHTGDLSKNFESALNSATGGGSTITAPSSGDIASQEAKAEAARLKAEMEAARQNAAAINENANKNTESRNKVTIASTNVITTNNNSATTYTPAYSSGGGAGYQTASQKDSSILLATMQ